MKILLIQDSGNTMGGTETHVRQLNLLLTEKGHDVSVLYLSEQPAARAPSRLRECLAKTPDIVHVHGLDHKYLPLLRIVRAHGVPLVKTEHDHRMFCLSGSFFSRGSLCLRCRGGRYFEAALQGCVNYPLALSTYAGRTLMRHNPYDAVDLFITPSDYLKNELRACGLCAKTERLYHFLPDVWFEPPGERQKGAVLFTGRLSPIKGVDVLLDAAEGLPFPFTIVGGGELEEKVRVRAASLGNVTFKGTLQGEAYRREVQAASLLVAPSLCPETMGLTAAEAFASGVPVVASRLGGLGELAGNGERGLAVEPGSVEDLRAKIAAVMKSEELQRTLSEAARAFALEHFSRERYTLRLLEVYESLAQRPPDSPRSAARLTTVAEPM